MFKKEMGLLSLSAPPTDEFIEDTILELMERIYKKAFRELYAMPEHDYIDIKYEDFVKDPMPYMEKIYDHLGLDGFEAAKPNFQKYLDSMQNYKTNHYQMDGTLRKKINEKLGFYFEHYGYDMVFDD
jgi:LPS sulfotransferase NodH